MVLEKNLERLVQYGVYEAVHHGSSGYKSPDGHLDPFMKILTNSYTDPTTTPYYGRMVFGRTKSRSPRRIRKSKSANNIRRSLIDNMGKTYGERVNVMVISQPKDGNPAGPYKLVGTNEAPIDAQELNSRKRQNKTN